MGAVILRRNNPRSADSLRLITGSGRGPRIRGQRELGAPNAEQAS